MMKIRSYLKHTDFASLAITPRLSDPRNFWAPRPNSPYRSRSCQRWEIARHGGTGLFFGPLLHVHPAV